MKWIGASVVGCLVLLSATALGLDGSGRAQAGGGTSTLDERATRLRRDLGPFCRDFDFYFKHAFSNGEMRPVRCSRRGKEKTVVMALAFTSRSLRDSWINEWGTLAQQRDEPVIKGRRWVVEILQPRWESEVRAELED